MQPNNYGQNMPGYGQPGTQGYVNPNMQMNTGMTPNMQPQMCMPPNIGMQPGMTGRPDYVSMNIQKHHLGKHQFDRKLVKKTGLAIFVQHAGMKGWVPANQVPVMVNQFTQLIGHYPIPPQDVFYVLSYVETNGCVNEKQWKTILKVLSGHKDISWAMKKKSKHKW